MHPGRFEPQHQETNEMTHLVTMGLFVIFFAAVIFGLVYLINRYARLQTSPHTDDPLALAKVRYAKGEINKEEFTLLKKDLA